MLSFSLATLVSLSKSAGALIKPHIPLLITALLESFSGLEPQVMSYLSLHLAGSQESQDKVCRQIKAVSCGCTPYKLITYLESGVSVNFSDLENEKDIS